MCSMPTIEIVTWWPTPAAAPASSSRRVPSTSVCLARRVELTASTTASAPASASARPSPEVEVDAPVLGAGGDARRVAGEDADGGAAGEQRGDDGAPIVPVPPTTATVRPLPAPSPPAPVIGSRRRPARRACSKSPGW